MFKAYKFPLQLFFFFERLSLQYWTSTVIKPQHYVIFWPAQAAGVLSQVFKHELNLSQSYLVDASCIDTSAYSPSTLEFNSFFRQNRYLTFYLLYTYHLKSRFTLCFPHAAPLASFEDAYPNANWLEREFSELYGVQLQFKKDSRNLLLDYTALANPMKKGYPCVGEEEIFYNPLEEALVYYPNTAVEL
jgi:NADH:ubiquinone oxidoreductase subunit C